MLTTKEERSKYIEVLLALVLVYCFVRLCMPVNKSDALEIRLEIVTA